MPESVRNARGAHIMGIFLAICMLSLCGVFGCEGGFGGFSRSLSSHSEPSAYLESPHEEGGRGQAEEEVDLPPHQLATRSRPHSAYRGELGRRQQAAATLGYVRQRAEYPDQDGGVYGQDGRFYRHAGPRRQQVGLAASNYN